MDALVKKPVDNRPILCIRLAQARKAAQPKITQTKMAELLGMDQGRYKHYETRTPIPRQYAIQAAKILGVPKTAFLLDDSEPAPRNDESAMLTNVRPSNAAVPNYTSMTKDLPVWFTAEAGEGAFFMDTGNAIDYVRRPVGLENKKNAYGIYVEGNSMEPVHDPGDLLYVDPNRRPKAGRDCIVVLNPRKEGEQSRYLLKRLVRQTATKWVFRQYNPEREISFDIRHVAAVHLVLKNHEINI